MLGSNQGPLSAKRASQPNCQQCKSSRRSFFYPSLKRDSNLWNQNFLPALPIKTKTWSIWFCKQIIFQNYQTRKIFANLDLKTKKSANFLISNFGSFPVREIAPPPQWPPRPVNAKKSSLNASTLLDVPHLILKFMSWRSPSQEIQNRMKFYKQALMQHLLEQLL